MATKSRSFMFKRCTDRVTGLSLAASFACLLLLLQPTMVSTAAMTVAEQAQILAKHNDYRKGEGATNMMYMIWDPTLATIAQNWSDGCDYEHGQAVNSSSLSELNMGQNLFLTSSMSTIDLDAAVAAWFNEKTDYTFSTSSCASGKVCGHYTQVVWAKSYKIGCGYATCSSITSSSITSGTILTCNYSPGGNFVGQPVYIKGSTPCTQCDSGQFYCNDGLCNDLCTGPGPSCVCAADCKNCATLTSDCRCQCGTGWTGVDCSVVCEDTHEYCNNGWYASWCVPERQYVLDGCPAMCGLCTAGTPAECLQTTEATTAVDQPVTTAAPVTAQPPSTVIVPTVRCVSVRRRTFLLKRPASRKRVIRRVKRSDKFQFLERTWSVRGKLWLRVKAMRGRRGRVGWIKMKHVRKVYRARFC